MELEHPQPVIDWRYRVATELTKDWLSPYTGVLHKKGSPVTANTYVQHGDRRIRIGDPSAPALFLSQAQRMYNGAVKIHPFVGEWPPKDGRDPSVTVYDYLEQMSAAVVFSYAAIEAFANDEIPADFMWEHQTEGGVYVAQNKEWVERHLTLDEKLHGVLPAVTQKPSPKGLAVWGYYVHLRKLRHRLIHLKKADHAASTVDNPNPDTVWSNLLCPKQPNYPVVARDIIAHFCDTNKIHWLKYCPF